MRTKPRWLRRLPFAARETMSRDPHGEPSKKRHKRQFARDKRQRKVQLSYRGRNEALAQLGFRSYEKYLHSPLWHRISARRLAMDSFCAGCGGKATTVHHQAYYYDLLAGADDAIKKDLYPLCHACHRKIEFDEGHGGRKRTFGEVVITFNRLLAKRQKASEESRIWQELCELAATSSSQP